MSYSEVLAKKTIAISASECSDMSEFGLSPAHLIDAMSELARHLLALGARLAYGGDLRPGGFSDLLFELVTRYRRDADERDAQSSIASFLAWPIHIQLSKKKLSEIEDAYRGFVDVSFLTIDGRTTNIRRRRLPPRKPTQKEWIEGLASMRVAMLRASNARIVLGGKVDEFRGEMPGVAAEALLSLQSKQPLFVLGGFGGCARDVAEELHLVSPHPGRTSLWDARKCFAKFNAEDLRNGLSVKENAVLAQTAHTDQAVALVLRGLVRTMRGASA